jgi:3-hydroxyisobutyrate dehydrogenase
MKALNNLGSAGEFLIGIEELMIGQRIRRSMVDVPNAAGMNNSTQKKFKQFVISRRFDAGLSRGCSRGPVDRFAGWARDRDAGASVGACQGDGGGGNVRLQCGSHGDGEIVRAAGRDATRPGVIRR